MDDLAGRAHSDRGARAAGGRFIAGDPLRAIAALSIMTLHGGLAAAGYAGGGFGAPEFVLPAFYHGLAAESLIFLSAGLYIFFALSGYLIARPFIRAFVAGDPLPAIVPYVRNRVLRIVPGFWLVFTLALLVAGTLGASLVDIAVVYLFMQVHRDSEVDFLIAQTWTLQTELAFYALIPVAAVLATVTAGRHLGPRGRLNLVMAAACVVYVASLVVRGLDPNDADYVRTVPPMPFAFCPGVLLATIEIGAEDRARGSGRARTIAIALVPVGLAILASFSALPVDSQSARGVLVSLGATAIVAGALVYQWATGGAWRVLDNRVMHWLGERSYSIYLVHFAVFYVLRDLATVSDRRTVSLVVVLALGGGVSILVSAFTYRFFELPFLRLRRGWRRPAPGAAR